MVLRYLGGTVHSSQIIGKLCRVLRNFGEPCKAFGYLENYKECSNIWENCAHNQVFEKPCGVLRHLWEMIEDAQVVQGTVHTSHIFGGLC